MKVRFLSLLLAAVYGSTALISLAPASAAEAQDQGSQQITSAKRDKSDSGMAAAANQDSANSSQKAASDSQSADSRIQASKAGLGNETADLEAKSKPGGSSYEADGRSYEQIINTRNEKLIALASEYYRYNPGADFVKHDDSINTTFSNGKALSYEAALDKVKVLRYPWFDELYLNVITRIPEKSSSAERADHEITQKLTATTGWRKQLAVENINLKKDYMISHFAQSALGDVDQMYNLQENQDYLNLDKLWVASTSVMSPMDYDRMPYTSEILKKRFYRERPNKANNFSFPSGHTFAGFEYATVMSMIFPERTREIMSNALQFGESRVIVKAHWATDTIASRTASYFNMAKILGDDELRHTIVKHARKIRNEVANACGDSVSSCLASQEEPIADRYATDGDKIGYYGMKLDEEDVAQHSITPEDLPKGAENLLRLRFPYLSDQTRRQILADTAYPADTLAGWMIEKGNADTYWGLIDLPKAARGPVKIDKTLVVNQTFDPEESPADLGQQDSWASNITGEGQLVKHGEGELTLAGDNSFGGFALQGGRLVLTGSNSFRKMSAVQNGQLRLVGGSIAGGLTAYEGAVVTGSGIIDKLTLNKGAQLRMQSQRGNDQNHAAKGSNPAQLTISNELVFNPGSDFRVELPADGLSATLQATEDIKINGGEVAVAGLKSLQNNADDSHLEEMSYRILSAGGSISGKFDGVRIQSLPNMTASLEYRPHEVILNFKRKDSGQGDAADNDEQSEGQGTMQQNDQSGNESARQAQHDQQKSAADQQAAAEGSSPESDDPFSRLYRQMQNSRPQAPEPSDSDILGTFIKVFQQKIGDGEVGGSIRNNSAK